MADPDGNAYGPYDVEVPGSDAEPFTEEAWYRIHDQGGVRSGGALTFSGLTAHLAPILVESHGSYLYREEPWDDASPPTTGALPRRDLMVARRVLTVGTGSDATPGYTVPLVLRGTPAGSPVNPAFDPVNDELLWSWQVPASGGTAVTSITDHRRFRGPYGEMGSGGLVVLKKNSTDASTTDATEQRLSGSHNVTAVALAAGRAYQVKAIGRVQTAGSDGLVRILARAARGSIPTTSSPILADTQEYCHASGSGGRRNFKVDGLFQVLTGATNWQIHLFGVCVSVSPTSLTVVEDSTTWYSVAVYDCGPATTDVPTITV